MKQYCLPDPDFCCTQNYYFFCYLYFRLSRLCMSKQHTVVLVWLGHMFIFQRNISTILNNMIKIWTIIRGYEHKDVYALPLQYV